MKEPGACGFLLQASGTFENRRSLVSKTIHLREGSPETFEFQVDDYIRQVNLVAVNLAAGKCALSIVPPESRPDEMEGITLSNYENYSMAVLSTLEALLPEMAGRFRGAGGQRPGGYGSFYQGLAGGTCSLFTAPIKRAAAV